MRDDILSQANRINNFLLTIFLESFRYIYSSIEVFNVLLKLYIGMGILHHILNVLVLLLLGNYTLVEWLKELIARKLD